MSKQQVLDKCIYTIAHSDKLNGVYEKGGSGELTEKRSWSTGNKLLIQAKREDKILLIFFAPAEDTTELIYRAKLEAIYIDTSGTRYEFSELTPYHAPKTSLVVASTGEKLHADYIRPYSVCKTPNLMKYPALPEKRLTGAEKFHDGGEFEDFSVLNFWQWSASQLAANNLRGHLAEFLVAQALGLADGQRVEWDSNDMVTKSGVKVEVKSAAYLQSWDQSELSKIGFGVAEAQAWDDDQGQWTTESQRNSDVYVFCLVDTKDQSQLDVTDTAQWKFYVVATSELNTKLGAQKTLSLGRLETLRYEKCSFSGIQASICSALGISCL